MKELTIKQIHEKQFQLEFDIKKMLISFAEETGVEIKSGAIGNHEEKGMILSLFYSNPFQR